VLAGGRDLDASHHCLATTAANDSVILPNHVKALFTNAKCLPSTHEVNQLLVICNRGGKRDLVRLHGNGIMMH